MKLHYSLLLVLILALYTNSIIEFALFFGCIILHEAGHIFFIIFFKQKVKQINLNIFGGQVDCEIKNLSIIKNIIINLGGVLVNLTIIKFSYLIPKYQNFLISYNYLLIFINLVPIYPLDGYRVCESLLSSLNAPSLEFLIITYLSFLCLLFLFLYGVLMQSYIIILACIVLGIKNGKRIKNKDELVLKKMLCLFS